MREDYGTNSEADAGRYERVSEHRDALAREVADLLAEWRKTCSLTGMRWTDKDAGAFVADAIGHRVVDEDKE